VVVDDLDLHMAVIVPDKTDAPLVVDPDALLANSITAQRLKSVPGR
jgi:hypothetical protein